MSLADDARNIAATVKATRCDVADACDTLGHDEVWEAISDHTIPATSIAEAMQSRGVDISDHTLRRHRQGRCQWCANVAR